MSCTSASRTLFTAGLLLLGACADGGPGDSRVPFDARLDGARWESDTAIAVAFGAPTDTTLSVAAARTVSPAEEQQISFSLHGFSGTGPTALGDSTATGIGSFSISQVSGGVIVSTLIYRTTASTGGTVRITDVDRGDSTVTGTFDFEVALTPDTAAHRRVRGTFFLQLDFVPVFVP